MRGACREVLPEPGRGARRDTSSGPPGRPESRLAGTAVLADRARRYRIRGSGMTGVPGRGRWSCRAAARRSDTTAPVARSPITPARAAAVWGCGCRPGRRCAHTTRATDWSCGAMPAAGPGPDGRGRRGVAWAAWRAGLPDIPDGSAPGRVVAPRASPVSPSVDGRPGSASGNRIDSTATVAASPVGVFAVLGEIASVTSLEVGGVGPISLTPWPRPCFLDRAAGLVRPVRGISLSAVSMGGSSTSA